MNDDRIENGICLAVVVIAVLFCASISRGDDAEYWKAKATSAIAISTAVDANPWNPPKPPPVPSKGPKTPRKVVYVIYAPFACPPCEIEKADLKGWNDNPDAAFEVREPKPGEIPYGAQFYPYTLWQNGAGEWVHLQQWQGADDLVKVWKMSQTAWHAKAIAKSVTAPKSVWWTTAELRSFASSYRGPTTPMARKRDSYLAHLLDHGYSRNQIQGLNETEAARIHGATHAGYLSPTHITK